MNGFVPLVADFVDWLASGLTFAIYAGECATILAAVALVVNLLFRRWLSARQMGLLWGLVLLRLLVPVAPGSSFSFQNPLAAAQSLIDRANLASGHAGYAAEAPSLDWETPYQEPRPLKRLAAEPTSQTATSATAAELVENWLPWIWLNWMPWIWLAGATGSLLSTACAHARLCKVLRRHLLPCNEERLCRLWHECLQLAGMRRRVPVATLPGLQQPAVAGLFRPRLLLPEDATDLDDLQLRMIMLHELAHVRRWHIAANWALALVRAVHWWNPIFWLAAARFQSLREQACDAFALERLEGPPTRDYSELLLMLAQRPTAPPRWRIALSASLLGFWSSLFRKRSLRNRLKALKSAGVHRSRWHAAAVGGLIGLTALCGFTDASAPEPPPEPASEWLPRTDHDWTSWGVAREADPGPDVTRVYNIEEALRTIAAAEHAADDAPPPLEWHIVHLVESLENWPAFHSPFNPLNGGAAQSSPNKRRPARERATINGGELTVQAPLHVHAELARNLHAWEQSGLGQTSVETLFITAERDIATAPGISWQYLEAFSGESQEELPAGSDNGVPVVRAKAIVDDYLPIAVARLNAEEAAAIYHVVQNKRTESIVQGPKVTLFNGQRATVFDCTQTPFVVGVQEGAKGVPEPKIVVIDEGIKLTLRTIQSSDGARVQLECRIELSEINEVRTASTTLRNKPTAIQLPRVKRCRIDINSEVEDGQPLLIGCFPGYERKKFFYVLLTARNLDL